MNVLVHAAQTETGISLQTEKIERLGVLSRLSLFLPLTSSFHPFWVSLWLYSADRQTCWLHT